jgi:hypothetical protein
MKFTGGILFFLMLISFLSKSFAAGAPPPQAYQIHVGSSQVLRSLSGEDLDTEDRVTLEAWVNFTQFGEFNQFVIGKAGDDFGQDWDYRFWIDDRVYQPGGEGPLGFQVSRASEGLDTITVEANVAIPLREWVHIAGIYDESGARVYVNGSLAGSVEAQTTELDRGLPFMIGNGHSYGYNGAFREVRLWNRALTDEELEVAAQGNLPSNIEGLLGHWPLDDGRGQFARNLVGSPGLARGYEGLTEELYSAEPTWQLAEPFFEIREDLAIDIPTEQFGSAILPAVPIIKDLNGDGLDDVVLSTSFSTGFNTDSEVPFPLRVLMNDGSGAYYDAAEEVFADGVPEAKAAYKIVIEDFNGDGQPDLYSENHGTDDVEQLGEKDLYYLSDEEGRWVDSFDSHISAPPCTESQPAFEGQNPCTSTWQGEFRYPALEGSAEPPQTLYGLAAGDIDNDGDLDILIGASSEDTLEGLPGIDRPQPFFLINDGNGNLAADWQRVPQEMIHSKTLSTNFNDHELADLDNDGWVDLLIFGRGETGLCCADRHYTDGESYVFWNPGNGSFEGSEATKLPNVEKFIKAEDAPFLLDIDNDGDLDIFVARSSIDFQGSYIQILVNNGDRTFTDETHLRIPIQSGHGNTYINLRSIDLNSDGCPDLLKSKQVGSTIGEGFNPDVFWLNDCAGVFRRLDSTAFPKIGDLYPVQSVFGELDFISYKLGPSFADFAVLDSVREFSEPQPPYPSMVLTNGISGAWYDPSHDGEGWIIEILDENRASVFWFSYPPTVQEGKQAWFFGVGEIIGNRIKIDEMLISSGGLFGPEYDPNSVQFDSWGSTEFIFDDCNKGTMNYSGPDNYGSGSLQLERLANLQGAGCIGPNAPANPKSFYLPRKGAEVGYSHSGAWYDPSHNGEGFLLEVLNETTALMVWFSYDNQGNQAWMISLGAIDGNEISFDEVQIPTGAVFGPGFDPTLVVRNTWGAATMTFHDCNSATVRYSSNDESFGSGEQQTIRLTFIEDLKCY